MTAFVGNTRYRTMVNGNRVNFVTTKLLPYDAEIEYLQGDGSAYINTGVKNITATDGFAVEVAMMSTSLAMVFGWSTSTLWFNLNLYHASKKNTELAWGTAGAAINITAPNVGDFHTYSADIINNKIHLYDDGVDKGNRNTSTDSSNKVIYLFGRNNNGTAGNITTAKIKKFQYMRNGEYLVDMIHVRVGTTGYMYDKVSGTLFGNDGTGSFTLGPDKN